MTDFTTPEKALPDNYIDINSKNCQESSPVDFLYLSTIRGGRKMKKGGGCGCNMSGGNKDDDDDNDENDDNDYDVNLDNENNMNGGCFTCKKGIRNITHIYSTVHIIIPSLYSKYKKELSIKEKDKKIKKGKKKGF